MPRRISRPSPSRIALTTALVALFGSATAAGAQQSTQEWLERCADRQRGNGNRVTHCEVREATLSAPGRLEVSARPNGGVDVVGEDRSDVHVTARVQTWAESDAEARSLAREVQIETGQGRVSASGPSLRNRDDRGWSVSYVIATPRRQHLDLSTVNGGLNVDGVAGDHELTTTNGGIAMVGGGGRVRARTTNGSVDVRLTGTRWAGEELDLRTTNGGITLSVPDGFAANLTASTVHGGIDTDFPVTMQGRIGRSINAEIGGGGPPVRLSTTNGGIDIRRN